jgi:hypothetical protein
MLYFASYYEAVRINLHGVNGREVNKQWTERDLEGSARGLIVVLSQN